MYSYVRPFIIIIGIVVPKHLTTPHRNSSIQRSTGDYTIKELFLTTREKLCKRVAERSNTNNGNIYTIILNKSGKEFFVKVEESKLSVEEDGEKNIRLLE